MYVRVGVCMYVYMYARWYTNTRTNLYIHSIHTQEPKIIKIQLENIATTFLPIPSPRLPSVFCRTYLMYERTSNLESSTLSRTFAFSFSPTFSDVLSLPLAASGC